MKTNLNHYVNFVLKTWMKQKMNVFYIYEQKKIKINFFSHNKLKVNLEPRNEKSVHVC